MIKSEYVKNVATVMLGTSVAQAIPIATAPILTRIYTPNDFGVFAIYITISAILSVIATGRYEMAIMLPKSDAMAANIIALSLVISTFVCTLAFVFIFFQGDNVANYLGNEELKQWLYFIPLTVFLTSLYHCLSYWSNRKSRYKVLSLSRVSQSFTTAAAQTGAGYTGFTSVGLLFGMILGQIFAVVLLMKVSWDDIATKVGGVTKLKIIVALKRYRKFPKIDVPTTILGLSAAQAPNILLASMFSTSYGGFFFLTQRVLQAPITLISSSVLDVFKQKAIECYARDGQAKEIYIKTFLALLAMGTIPTIVLYFTITDIFAIVFGSEWVIAGEYAQIMLPALFLRFMTNPLSYMIYIAERQDINLFGMAFLFVGVISSFLIAHTHYEAIIGLSITYTVVYTGYLIISARLAGCFHFLR